MRLLILLFCLLQLPLFAQLNSELVGRLDYEAGVNDVWGYVAPDGTEYAIVGLVNGVSIVSLAEPSAPEEVAFVAGVNSPWRDMKTYGEYAYVTADRGLGGLTIIDLRNLPAEVTSINRLYELPGFEDEPYGRAHNIYIDTTTALAYLAGGDLNLNRGGMVILDLEADPWNPPLVATGPPVYAHDVYVRDGLMYASEIYEGDLTVYDVRNIDSIFEVGRTRTPFEFTHNAWTTDDGGLVFTTDEVGNAPVAAFDLSDLDDIEQLDTYRPLSSLNTRTIPHNVHVIDNYLSISYYTDGLRVVDASVPDNLVEVANYDTWGGPDGGFNGAWGAYPFLPSGLTLVSDRQSGLFVIDIDYQRAARIIGSVTDAETGGGINGADVALVAEQPSATTTGPGGNFATGIATAGDYTLRIEAFGYYPDSATVTIGNGETTEQDITLRPRPETDVSIELRDRRSEETIPAAAFSLAIPQQSFTGRADSNGIITVGEVVYDYDYDLRVTAWGYRPLTATFNGNSLGDTIIYLDRGYEDDFATDLGWSVTGDAARGNWERAAPEQTQQDTLVAQPRGDVAGDFGSAAYVTGPRDGNNVGSYDVDGGTTVLTSPPIVLNDSLARDAYVSYAYYFVNLPFTNAAVEPDDSLTVSIIAPDTTLRLRTYRGDEGVWVADTVAIGGRFEAGDTLYLRVATGDVDSLDHIVEAGFDNFFIGSVEALVSTPAGPGAPVVSTRLFPNPTGTRFTLGYTFETATAARLQVFDATGRLRLERPLGYGRTGTVRFGDRLGGGVYFIRLIDERGRQLSVMRGVKLMH